MKNIIYTVNYLVHKQMFAYKVLKCFNKIILYIKWYKNFQRKYQALKSITFHLFSLSVMQIIINQNSLKNKQTQNSSYSNIYEIRETSAVGFLFFRLSILTFGNHIHLLLSRHYPLSRNLYTYTEHLWRNMYYHPIYLIQG